VILPRLPRCSRRHRGAAWTAMQIQQYRVARLLPAELNPLFYATYWDVHGVNTRSFRAFS